MGFIKKLFGRTEGAGAGAESSSGIFLYVRCSNCGDRVRLFVLKSQELNPIDGGYIWHKTIIDNKCFRPIQTIVTFDRAYNVANSEIDGGEYITLEEYELAETT